MTKCGTKHDEKERNFQGDNSINELGLKVLVKFGMNLDKSHCLPPEKNCGPSFPFSTLRDSKVVRYIRQNLTESTTDLPVLFKFGQSAA